MPIYTLYETVIYTSMLIVIFMGTGLSFEINFTNFHVVKIMHCYWPLSTEIMNLLLCTVGEAVPQHNKRVTKWAHRLLNWIFYVRIKAAQSQINSIIKTSELTYRQAHRPSEGNITDELDQSVTLPASIREVSDSSLGLDTDYPNGRVSWFSSVPPGKYPG
jgi:hypothetical protein